MDPLELLLHQQSSNTKKSRPDSLILFTNQEDKEDGFGTIWDYYSNLVPTTKVSHKSAFDDLIETFEK